MAKLINNFKPLLMRYYEVQNENDLPSQERIAKEFGVSQTTVSRWLNDKVDRFDIPLVAKICKQFRSRIPDVNLGDLLTFDFGEGQRPA